jgi:peptidoglycan/LPS O-acetylase OafA/YrhL
MQASSTDSPKFIDHLHAFRGFAILTIVAAHSWSYLLFMGPFETMPAHNRVYSIVETLFHGSTIFFALISGLLFSMVLQDKGWRKFFSSKIKNVVSPYAFVNLLFLSAFWPMYRKWMESNGETPDFLLVYFNGLLSGDLMLQYWYIPVLIVLYVATPLFSVLVKHRALVWVAWLLALAPLVVSRTIYPQLLSGATIVYFAGAYILGMLIGENYAATRELIGRHLGVFWLITIGCSLVIGLQYINEFEAESWFSSRESLFYAQKLSMAALAVHYLSRWETSLPKWLFTLGTYAFAIYFLHFFFVNMTAELVTLVAQDKANAFIAAAGGLFILLASIGLSLLTAWLLKKLFRRYSRLFIGV